MYEKELGVSDDNRRLKVEEAAFRDMGISMHAQRQEADPVRIRIFDRIVNPAPETLNPRSTALGFTVRAYGASNLDAYMRTTEMWVGILQHRTNSPSPV